MQPIADALKELALKLGTTTEYLWGVLIKQAPISATIQLGQAMFFVVVAVLFYFKVMKMIRGGELSDENFGAVVVTVIFGTVVAAGLLTAILSFGDVINGYFSPEYWALNEILSKLK
jgi:hypothetical protein